MSASDEIGRRTHPATGRTITYLACTLTDDTEPAAAAAREIAEVRWASLDELDQLMPDLYAPAREHLAALLDSRRTGEPPFHQTGSRDPEPRSP